VSINKAGINATLPTRTAVLAAANPISGRYNRDITLMENIKFPPTLLSRFDLIFIVTDVPEEHADFDLAEHILNTHKEKMKKDIDPLFFKKYIAYAKRFNPTLTRETIDFIKKFYVDMRKKATEKVIPITARQLEAIQRLAEARARIQLKTQVDVDDAKRAVLVMCKSLESLGVDLEQPDIDRKELGIPSTKTEQMEEVYKIIRDFQRDHEVARVDEVIEEATKRLQISKDEVMGILKRLHDRGRTLQHSVSELTTAF
jgi:replicative DNA helicase Mcm